MLAVESLVKGIHFPFEEPVGLGDIQNRPYDGGLLFRTFHCVDRGSCTPRVQLDALEARHSKKRLNTWSLAVDS